jgi:hypothetical protein
MGWLGDFFAWHDAFGNLSYALIAVSYYLTRMFWLRALAVLGLSLEILYFHFSGGQLNTGIGWNLVFIAINLYQLWRLVLDARKGHLGPEHELLRQGILAGLDDAQLGRLFRMGGWRDLGPGTLLTREGQPVPELYLLCLGHAEVDVEGVVVARLAPGSFVGEMAFLSGSTASATVRIQEPARIFAFDTAKLRKLIAQDEQIATVMHRSVGQDLANKLRRSSHGTVPMVA